ncbi:MAG: protein kinase [Bryobacteraceae bacterium]
MSAANWPAVKAAFAQCCPLGDTERSQCLAALPDANVAREVQSLLRFFPASAGFLDESAVDIFLRTSDPWMHREIAGYRLTELIGEGGTARVYRAERIDGQFRKVTAVKLLKAGIFGEDIRRRFLRERQLLADLDHPNIIRLLDGGVTPDGRPYIVMEFVDGVPITQYAHDAALSPVDRLSLMRQAVNAIAYAHRKGVIHRDIKPGNILVNREGQVKLLDFGIAHLTANTPEDGIYTQTQTRLWTPAYASPEQAKAEKVLPESDLYSLGVILYELLEGKLPYSVKGLPQHEIIRVICTGKPQGQLLPVLARLLSKDAASRGTATQLEAELATPGNLLSSPRPLARRWFLAVTAITVLAFCAGLWWRSTPAPLLQFPEPTTVARHAFAPTISPDGTKIAYIDEASAQDQYLTVKDLRTGQVRRLIEATHARWSPDGSQLAILTLHGATGGAIALVDYPSGQVTELASLRSRLTQQMWQFDLLNWSIDGKEILVADTTEASPQFSIQALDVQKKTWRQLTHPPAGAFGDSTAVYSPDGRTLAFVRMVTTDNADVYVLRDGQERRLTHHTSITDGLTWAPDGKAILFSTRHNTQGARLWRIDYPEAREVQVALDMDGHLVMPSFSKRISTGGWRLAFHRRIRDVNVWMGNPENPTADRQVSLAKSTNTIGVDCCPDLSPNGNFVAFASDINSTHEIWVSDLRTGAARQLTAMNGPYTDSPRWSPDGSQIAFTSAIGQNRDVFLVPPDGGAVRRFTTEPSEEGRPAWSRDGRWLYFRSSRSGENQIWRRRTDGTGAPQQVTHQGGYEGYESHDGKTLYYARKRSSNEIWALPLSGGEEQLVIDGRSLGFWGVGRDGIYFLEKLSRSHNAVLKRVPFAGGIEEQLRTIQSTNEITTFRMSWNGDRILWTQTDQIEDNVMVVDWPLRSH